MCQRLLICDSVRACVVKNPEVYNTVKRQENSNGNV